MNREQEDAVLADAVENVAEYRKGVEGYAVKCLTQDVELLAKLRDEMPLMADHPLEAKTTAKVEALAAKIARGSAAYAQDFITAKVERRRLDYERRLATEGANYKNRAEREAEAEAKRQADAAEAAKRKAAADAARKAEEDARVAVLVEKALAARAQA